LGLFPTAKLRIILLLTKNIFLIEHNKVDNYRSKPDFALKTIWGCALATASPIVDKIVDWVI
ncbi:MAG: hypothetical protein ACI31D_02760, partial [Candidatus Limisoma sp.]